MVSRIVSGKSREAGRQYALELLSQESGFSPAPPRVSTFPPVNRMQCPLSVDRSRKYKIQPVNSSRLIRSVQIGYTSVTPEEFQNSELCDFEKYKVPPMPSVTLPLSVGSDTAPLTERVGISTEKHTHLHVELGVEAMNSLVSVQGTFL